LTGGGHCIKRGILSIKRGILGALDDAFGIIGGRILVNMRDR